MFGYGSLADDFQGATARLSGHRLTWGVAMDNTEDVPGYKHYETVDGERPDVRVCFLDIEPDPGASVNGVLVAVEDPEQFDRRERNYVRLDVTDLIDGAEGRVWAYFGAPEGRRRRHGGPAVISRAYLERVERALGQTIATEGLPVWDLTRVEHP